MDILFSLLVVAHFIGLAAIVGPFLLQMRSNGGFAISPSWAERSRSSSPASP